MKLRDMMFLVIGGLLVISGMVLNALISGNVEAQDAMGNGYFNKIICKNLMIYGDDGETIVAYLGVNEDGEIDEYFWKDLTMSVSGMAWDEHWLNFTFEELNETEGTWSMWVGLLVWNEEAEDYYFEQQFDIPMIRVEGGE